MADVLGLRMGSDQEGWSFLLSLLRYTYLESVTQNVQLISSLLQSYWTSTSECPCLLNASTIFQFSACYLSIQDDTILTSPHLSRMLLNSTRYQVSTLSLCPCVVLLRKRTLVQPRMKRSAYIVSYYLMALRYLARLPSQGGFQLLVYFFLHTDK